MAVERYISSDSHVLEPADLWVEQMDKAFRAQAPRVVHNPPGYEGDYWIFGDRRAGDGCAGLLCWREPEEL